MEIANPKRTYYGTPALFSACFKLPEEPKNKTSRAKSIEYSEKLNLMGFCSDLTAY